MRKQRDGNETKERVLSAAQKLFADNGFAGTSLAMIAKESGISEGLILHHYQNKKSLYHLVLDNLAARYAEELLPLRQMDVGPEEMFQESLKSVFEFWKKDAAYERISLWAYLERQADFSEKEAVLTAGLVQVVGQLQKKGLVNDQIHPMVFLTTLIGSIHFWNRYRDQFKTSLNLPDSPDELDRLFLDQFTLLIKTMMSVNSKENG